jgi:hypothetical protein
MRGHLVLGVLTALVTSISPATAASASALAPESIIGTWRAATGTIRIEQTGPGQYSGVIVRSYRGSRNSCLFRSGQEKWQLFGGPPHFTGRNLWTHDRTCRYGWGKATFALNDRNTITVCSSSPWTGERECYRAARVR